MKRRKDLSVSSIYTNWLAVKNAKLAKNNSCKPPKLNINKSKQNSSSGPKQGVFHVFVRGYNSYTLFYDNEDRVHFLLILDEEAKRRETRICAFILMDNHFHLQITTSMISSLMRIVLSRYSRRFRKKYGIEGPVFQKPFGRSEIFSFLLAKENLLYILSNASREQMCPTHRDYIWSSYNSHPELIQLRAEGMLPILRKDKPAISFLNSREQLPTPKRCSGSKPSARMIAKYDINQVIEVDTSFMVNSFKDLQDLDYSIHNYKPLRSQLLNNQQFSRQSIHGRNINRQQTSNQQYNRQSINDQNINRQQTSNQQYNRQSINDQNINRQQTSNQQYNRQSINDQNLNRQQTSNQQYNRQSINDQNINRQQTSNQQYNRQSINDQNINRQQTSNQQHNRQAINDQNINRQQTSNQQHNRQTDSAYNNSQAHSLRKYNNFYKITPDSEVIDLFIYLLDGRKFTSLTNNERSQIIVKLKRIKKATNRQVSCIMRI